MSILRKILLPISLLYGLVTAARNKLYDNELLGTRSFAVPVLCVGNLSVGGTGKTPIIEYLLNLLLPYYKVATLSRGYGRKTSGFILLTGKESAKMVGDEPLQFKIKFPEAAVAVDEDRQRGISQLQSVENPEVILMDDALQHRKVTAGLNILLTTFGKLYADDFMLPTGDLREPATGAKRAKIIIVTKCPENLGLPEQERIQKKLKIKSYQQLFFSYIKYGDELKNDNQIKSLKSLAGKKFTLVTGIANPKSLLEYLENLNLDFEHLKFPDHHNFSKQEIKDIETKGIIVTTEKDFMRLRNVISNPGLYYLPIEFKFLNNASGRFNGMVENFIKKKN